MKISLAKLKSFTKKVKMELAVYRSVMKDKRTPLLPRLLIGTAVFYLLLPFDLIPDFIPVFGQLDDIILIPALIFIAIQLIPKNILKENRNKIYGFN